MTFTLETPRTIDTSTIEEAAELTALGFGRQANQDNLQDTAAHITGVDHLQLLRKDEELVAFAAYQRLLWRPCH